MIRVLFLFSGANKIFHSETLSALDSFAADLFIVLLIA